MAITPTKGPNLTKPGEKSTIPNPQDRDLDDPGRPGGTGSWGPSAHPGETGSAKESEEEGKPWAPPSEATPPYALPGAPPEAGPGWLPGDEDHPLPEGVSRGIYPGVHPGTEESDAAATGTQPKEPETPVTPATPPASKF